MANPGDDRPDRLHSGFILIGKQNVQDLTVRSGEKTNDKDHSNPAGVSADNA